MSKTFIIFSISEISKIDFNEVFETSPETLRYSLADDLTFVKFDGEQPSFIESLSSYELISENDFMIKLQQFPWAISKPYPDGSITAGNPEYTWDMDLSNWVSA